MYLLNPKKKKSVAHMWTGTDTVCKMFSTGGMKQKRQVVSEETKGKPLCHMCETVHNKEIEPQETC